MISRSWLLFVSFTCWNAFWPLCSLSEGSNQRGACHDSIFLTAKSWPRFCVHTKAFADAVMSVFVLIPGFCSLSGRYWSRFCAYPMAVIKPGLAACFRPVAVRRAKHAGRICAFLYNFNRLYFVCFCCFFEIQKRFLWLCVRNRISDFYVSFRPSRD